MPLHSLDSNHYLFGNKGSVWSNEAHIAQSGSFGGGTLCGTPMLSSNWVGIEGITVAGCPRCIAKYIKAKRKVFHKLQGEKPDFTDWLELNSTMENAEARELVRIADAFESKVRGIKIPRTENTDKV